MRAETAGVRTWLLGALALWALIFWSLGVAGFGGRIERLPEDPSLLSRLPQLAAPAEERLGPSTEYAAIGDQPLFSEDRQPRPFFINPESDEPQITFDYVLTSVLLVPGLQLAILHPLDGGEPVRLKVGEAPDAAPGWNLASINRRSVVFAGPEGDTTLELRVFDGTGGEAPTAMTVVPVQGRRGDSVDQVGGSAKPPQAVSTQGAPNQPPDKQTVVENGAPEQAAPQTPEAQVELIRERIEARRAQLRKEATAPNQVSPKPAKE